MLLIVLAVLFTSCGSVQTVNGVRIKPKMNHHNDVFIGVVSFGLGWYVGTYVIDVKKKFPKQ